MGNFVGTILAEIQKLKETARVRYGVDPVVFLVIYLVSVPFFYYSLFRLIRALAKRITAQVMLWSAVFLGSIIAPFLYPLLFGRNFPWWVYLLIALLVGQGIWSLVRKVRKKPPAGSETEPPDEHGRT